MAKTNSVVISKRVDGKQIVRRDGVVVGRCERITSALPGMSGRGGREAFYYVEALVGEKFVAQRVSADTIEQVRAYFSVEGA